MKLPTHYRKAHSQRPVPHPNSILLKCMLKKKPQYSPSLKWVGGNLATSSYSASLIKLNNQLLAIAL